MFNKALQKKQFSCDRWSMGTAGQELPRELLQIHSTSESNEIQRRRTAVQGHGGPYNLLCLKGEGNVPSLPLWTFPPVGQSLCLEPLRRYCCPSLFHFQSQSSSLISFETQFIRKRQLWLIILLYLTLLCLLGQNDSTQTPSHNQQS